jgi:putative heme-binding domain-containing protein
MTQHPLSYGLFLALLITGNLSTQIALADEEQATAAADISVADGFQIDLIYSVPQSSQGSWVVLTSDPRGRLVTCDQNGDLYRVTVAEKLAETTVERLDIPLGHAQGLLFAFDSLYVMMNGRDQENGLYRVPYDAAADSFGAPKLILPLKADGEHGPHTIIYSADRQSLVICAGNHSPLPKLAASRVPRVWDEDQLLRRIWDPNGHAVGRMAPGGWVCQLSPDGKQCELLSVGFRNQYDCARNADGELFTFDADMEWDIGTSWYRPTRILHMTSGSEFGWRGGCFKWPDYAADSLPAVIDMGPGSPSGIAFGTGAKFSPRYQRALFACDWGGGVMHAIHLSPDGASYRAEAEPFVSANALPFTDVTINSQDGALYFTTGGRGTQSGLYRVTQVKTDAADPTDVAPERDQETLTLRKELELLHRPNGARAQLDFVWEHLDHDDRHIRFAARTALEHVDLAIWKNRIVDEPIAGRRLAALLAQARVASELQEPFWNSLGQVDFASATRREQLMLLRVCEIGLARHATSCPAGLPLRQTLDAAFPSSDPRIDRQLCKILAHWNTPHIVGRSLSMVEAQSSPAGMLHYLLALQNSTDDWTTEEVRSYVSACIACKKGSGGKSYGGYVDDMVTWIEERIDAKTAKELSPEFELAKQKPAAFGPDVAREFVQEWTLDDLRAHFASNEPINGNRERGKQLFVEAHCARCHRIDELGGTVGPDLSTLGRRFSTTDALTAIVEPDRDISDQYRSTIFELESGKVVTGRVTNQWAQGVRVRTDMYNPGLLTSIKAEEIESKRLSPTSPMPSKLLDTLTLDEIQDLLAYLLDSQ